MEPNKTDDLHSGSKIEGKESNLTAYLFLGLGISCIGCSAIFVKIANVSGITSAFFRLSIAALILVPLWTARRSARPKRKDWGWIIIGGVLFAMDLAVWNSGILFTSVAAATLLANSAPLWVGLGTLLFFRERLSRKFWIGLFIALTGMTFIVGGNALRNLHFNTGDILCIASGLFYAAYLLTAQKARRRIDTLTFTSLTAAIGAIVLIPVYLKFGQNLIGFSLRTWLALLGLGLISHVTGWLSINKAIGRLRAAPVSVALLSQPVVTSVLGIIILGESLKNSIILGGIFVLLGIFLTNQRESG